MYESQQTKWLAPVFLLAFGIMLCATFVFGLKYAVQAVNYAHGVYGENMLLKQQLRDAVSGRQVLGMLQQKAMSDVEFRVVLESRGFNLVPPELLPKVDKKVEQPKQIQAKGK